MLTGKLLGLATTLIFIGTSSYGINSSHSLIDTNPFQFIPQHYKSQTKPLKSFSSTKVDLQTILSKATNSKDVKNSYISGIPLIFQINEFNSIQPI